jgi:hypothetical protein
MSVPGASDSPVTVTNAPPSTSEDEGVTPKSAEERPGGA